jgi:hypothetical protein
MKASEIKPGMVVNMASNNDYNDIVLIVATVGKIDIQYTHFTLSDPSCELLVGTIHKDQDVGIITGAKRKSAIEEIKLGQYRRKGEVKRDLETVLLIESMDELKGENERSNSISARR